MTEIRSYRRVFDLERRIYSVDRLRLNPGGIPLRGVFYFVALLLGGLFAARLPPVHAVAGMVPWFVRDLAAPGLGAMLLSLVRIEGRTFHVAAAALLRLLLEPRLIDGLHRPQAPLMRWHPNEILVLPDGSDACLRHVRYRGPGAVLVAVEHERFGPAPGDAPTPRGRHLRTRTLVLSQRGSTRSRAGGQVIVLEAGSRLVVRGQSRHRASR